LALCVVVDVASNNINFFAWGKFKEEDDSNGDSGDEKTAYRTRSAVITTTPSDRARCAQKPFLFAERSRHFDANVFSVVDIIIIVVVVVVLVLGAPLPLPAMSSSSAACRDAAETEGEENMMPLSFSPVLSFFVAPQKCGGEYDEMMMMMFLFFIFTFLLVSFF